jgi:hypothetical protein
MCSRNFQSPEDPAPDPLAILGGWRIGLLGGLCLAMAGCAAQPAGKIDTVIPLEMASPAASPSSSSPSSSTPLSTALAAVRGKSVVASPAPAAASAPPPDAGRGLAYAESEANNGAQRIDLALMMARQKAQPATERAEGAQLANEAHLLLSEGEMRNRLQQLAKQAAEKRAPPEAEDEAKPAEPSTGPDMIRRLRELSRDAHHTTAGDAHVTVAPVQAAAAAPAPSQTAAPANPYGALFPVSPLPSASPGLPALPKLGLASTN